MSVIIIITRRDQSHANVSGKELAAVSGPPEAQPVPSVRHAHVVHEDNFRVPDPSNRGIVVIAVVVVVAGESQAAAPVAASTVLAAAAADGLLPPLIHGQGCTWGVVRIAIIVTIIIVCCCCWRLRRSHPRGQVVRIVVDTDGSIVVLVVVNVKRPLVDLNAKPPRFGGIHARCAHVDGHVLIAI